MMLKTAVSRNSGFITRKMRRRADITPSSTSHARFCQRISNSRHWRALPIFRLLARVSGNSFGNPNPKPVQSDPQVRFHPLLNVDPIIAAWPQHERGPPQGGRLGELVTKLLGCPDLPRLYM